MTLYLDDSDLSEQYAKLRKYCFWIFVIGGVISVGQLVQAMGDQDQGLMLVSVANLVAAVLILGAWWLLGRQKTSMLYVVTLLSGSALFSAVLSSIGAPHTLPINTVLPGVAVMVGILYLGKQHLRFLLIISWLMSVTALVLGQLHLFPSPPPDVVFPNVVAGGAVVSGLLLTMLWNYYNRLSSMVQGLKDARATLEAQVEARTLELRTALTETQRLQEAEQGQRERLEQTVQELERSQAEEQRQTAEARRLQETEAENRQRLEQAVGEYLTFIQGIARGDLTRRLPEIYDGALGQLGIGLNQMVESLLRVTLQVQEAVSNISSAATEILAATTQQLASAAQQSASITQTTTTIQEIRSIAVETARQAAQVADSSQNMLLVAQQGTRTVEETVDGMQEIRIRVSSIAETILSLSDQTQTISVIIQTVNDLADQSNLLALNAAIEAARAGEQGKSFGVVAQHVRDLAERSKEATGQVREILGEVQSATNTAVMVTEEGTKGVEVGARLAGQAGQVIRRIAAEVEEGAQSNVQMAAAAQQQTAGIEQISQAMQNIQQATSQTLASTRQAERAAQDLNTLATSLRKTIAVYQVG
jgi:methyl-accepting chemotaxis protein